MSCVNINFHTYTDFSETAVIGSSFATKKSSHMPCRALDPKILFLCVTTYSILL